MVLKKLLFFSLISNLLISQNTQKLNELGFENLSEKHIGQNYTLYYEDNIYRFPPDGLYNVLNSLDINDGVVKIKVIILNKGIPIIEMSFNKDVFIEYRNGDITIEEFLASSKIAFTKEKKVAQKIINRSYFKTDLSLRFTLDYALGDFENSIKQRVNFQPMVNSDLSKGVNLQGYYNIPKFNELESIEPQIGILRLSNDFKLNQYGFLNINYGFFTSNRFGVTLNYLKFLYQDKLRFKFHIGSTRFGRLNKDLILFYQPNNYLYTDFHGDLAYRINTYDVDVVYRYGSFIGGDIGYSIQVRRFKNQRFIGLFYKKTNFGKMIGFDFSIPIPIRKYNRKRPIRLKLYDNFYLPYNYHSESNIAELYYEGDNIISQMQNYFPEIIRKGLKNASKKNGSR